jgi:uncharacterized 2Fe-2S/4Fe-4S cluster protein (DUF4445 family)
LQTIEKKILVTHIMLAISEAFKESYLLEQPYCNDGMSFNRL